MKAYLIIVALLAIPLTAGVTIQGSVYDFSLDPAEAVVEINTSPPQKKVAKYTFEFEVKPGRYTLSARKIEQGNVISYSEEEIEVGEEGVFVRDIVLFPDIDLEEFDEPEIDPSEFNSSSYLDFKDILIIAISLLALSLSYVAYRRFSRKEEDVEEDYKKVLDYIKENKRVTQKDIRKKFPFSEAKVSLILTELEDKELIKKVKKGRGNVIILN